MSTTQPTSGTAGSAPTDVNGNPLVNPTTQMDENSFLKLLVAQLQYQDPLSPTDSQAFVQEQAQFSMVEGILNVEKGLTALTTTTQLGQDIELIGKSVTYTNPDGSSSTGVVSGVATDSTTGAVTLTVGGASIDPATVSSIGAAPNSGTTAGG